MTGCMGGKLREELIDIGISGNKEPELARACYPSMKNHDTITAVDQGDNAGP